MLLINHPPLDDSSPGYMKTLAALHALSDSPSAFFTTGAPGDAEREELILGTQLFDLPVARRAYLYLLRSYIGRQVPEVMTAEQLGKQQLLAAQLFAEARNAFSKERSPQKELVAHLLTVRCALRSQMTLPSYLDEMGANFAKLVGVRAESLAREYLSQHDLPGFLAMTTIAFSAYEDNSVPLDDPELKHYSGLAYRCLVQLHEYLKVVRESLSPIDVAMIYRSMTLITEGHLVNELPEWISEILGHAPARAVTSFLREAAGQDKSRNLAKSALWWMHASEIFDLDAEFESWHNPFIQISKSESIKRLGEVAVKVRESGSDFLIYSYFSCLAHRLTLRMDDLPVAWLEGFRFEEARNVMAGIRRFSNQSQMASPNLTLGINGLLCIYIAKSIGDGVSAIKVSLELLQQILEKNEKQLVEI